MPDDPRHPGPDTPGAVPPADPWQKLRRLRVYQDVDEYNQAGAYYSVRDVEHARAAVEAETARLRRALDQAEASDAVHFKARIAAELRADRAEADLALRTQERDEAIKGRFAWIAQKKIKRLEAERDEARQELARLSVSLLEDFGEAFDQNADGIVAEPDVVNATIALCAQLHADKLALTRTHEAARALVARMRLAADHYEEGRAEVVLREWADVLAQALTPGKD